MVISRKHSRKRRSFAAGVAALILLALPSLASARPAGSPGLVQRSGRLVILHADRTDGTSTQQWALVNGADELLVRAPRDAWVEPGARVRLEGTMRNGSLVLSDSLTAVEQTGPSPLAADVPVTAAAPSMHDTAVILVGFTGGPTSASLPTDASGAATLMFGDPVSTPSSLNAYYQEQTYGQIGFSGTVFGPYDIAGPTGTCSISEVLNWKTQAFAAAGSPAGYRHYVYVFPDVSACGWSGLAEVGGSNVWVNGDFEVAVVAHELGHNLGLAHAGGLQCTSGTTPVSIGGVCNATGFEYKDPFDAMGQSDAGGGVIRVRQMSMEHKLALNLLPASAIQDVTASGSYHLAPMETLTGSVELLRIAKPGGGSYFVEYRWPIGYFDGLSPSFNGVYIRTESPEVAQDPFNPNADTALIDMRPLPGSPTWVDAKMAVGQVFNDALSGILIQDVAEDANGATLSITVPVAPPPVTTGGTGNAAAPAAGNTPVPSSDRPSAPANVKATATKGGEVLLAWGASTGKLAISGYRVLRGGTAIATTSSAAYVDRTPLAAGGTSVAYAVVAVDVGGNTSPTASAPPVRAALLLKLALSHLKAVRAGRGKHVLIRVSGTLSDAQALCRARVLRGPWHSCKVAPTGAFKVSVRPRGKIPVTISVRDAIGRVKLQTLRVR